MTMTLQYISIKCACTRFGSIDDDNGDDSDYDDSDGKDDGDDDDVKDDNEGVRLVAGLARIWSLIRNRSGAHRGKNINCRKADWRYILSLKYGPCTPC